MISGQRLGVVFPTDYEHLALARFFGGADCFIPNQPALAGWLGTFIPPERLVTYEPLAGADQAAGFEGIIKHTTLGQALQARRITCTSLWHVDRPMLAWFQARRIQVIAPPLGLIERLGNKISFDHFLAQHDLPRPKSRVIADLAELADIPGRLVLQEPVSSGSEGTFFVSSAAELAELTAAARLTAQTPYLVREFVEGKSYGITLFVGRRQLVLSLPRTQLFYNAAGAQRTFAGIQWDSSPSAAARAAINTVFARLGRILHGLGYFGYANFDFILQDQSVFLIECNPRFSQSTAHVFANPLLTGGVDTLALFVEGFFEPRPAEPEFCGIGDAVFAGCDINLRKDNLPQIPNGLYRLAAEPLDPAGLQPGCTYLGPDILQFSPHPQEFMLTGWFVDPAQNEEVGSITTNFPLFETETELNPLGKRLLKDVTGRR